MASTLRSGQRALAVGSGPLACSLDDLPAEFAAFRVIFENDIDNDNAKSLSNLIESEIIPRLVVAHSNLTPVVGSGPREYSITAAEIEALVPLVLQVEAEALLDHIESILAQGVPFDAVMVDLLAPTARLLGELWEDDLCDFADVTMGLWRLQEVVHEIAGRLPAERLHGVGGRRALFASMPGDQHSFGMVVVDEVFRRDGWWTDRIGEAETSDLLKRVAGEWFDIVGLTINNDCFIGGLSALIVALRNVSRNSQVCLMVGGKIFSETPELAMQVGADGTASDAKLALKVASQLLRERDREAEIRI